MKKITFIIPNYNGAIMLVANLPHILKIAQRYNAKIIIVDDASTDTSIELIKKSFEVYLVPELVDGNKKVNLQGVREEIILIRKLKNEGFSSTVNIGVLNATTELICLLNSDVIPEFNSLEYIFPHFNDTYLAAVGMKDLSDDGETHGRGKFIFHKGFILHKKYINDNSNSDSGVTGWVSCGSGVFRKKMWDEIGGLNDLLNPFYFEDVDLGYRLWKSGYKCYFEEKAIAQHHHNKGAIKTHYKSNQIKIISYRNQVLFTWKNLTDRNLILIHIVWFSINFVVSIKNRDKLYIKGVLLALKKLPEAIKIKKINREIFILTDKQVIEGV